MSAIDRNELARRIARHMFDQAAKGVVADDLRELGESLALPLARDLMASDVPYLIVEDGKAILCFTCGLVSHNPEDVEQRYCGKCHRFHDAEKP